jgi:SAM-dependent methyltransferase
MLEDYDCHLEAFRKGEIDDPRFFARFGLRDGDISFEGLRILDLGCGQGSLCLFMASRKAARVVGIDLKGHLIEFAKENLERNYRQLKETVSFLCCDISALSEEFDLIVSKNTFEHASNLELLLCEMEKRLIAGGKILTGFGPLYRSPYGDHGYLQMPKIPWVHLHFSDRYMINRLNKKEHGKIARIEDLGLNRLKVSQFEGLFKHSGHLGMVYFKTNAHEGTQRLLVKIFSGLNSIPCLREYFTYNIFCILQKRSSAMVE